MSNNVRAALLAPPSRFYVYVLSRPDGRPFYVGVGTTQRRGLTPRVFQHEVIAKRGRNTPKCNLIRKIWASGGSISHAIESWHETKEAAFSREIALIEEIGRVESGTGSLVNMNAGGTGQIDPTPEARAAMRRAQQKNAEMNRANAPHLAEVLPAAIAARREWERDRPDEFKALMTRAVSASIASRTNNPDVRRQWKEANSKAQKERFRRDPGPICRMNELGRAAAAKWQNENPEKVAAISQRANAASREWMAANPDAHRGHARKAAAAAAVVRQKKAALRRECLAVAEAIGFDGSLPRPMAPLAEWERAAAHLSALSIAASGAD